MSKVVVFTHPETAVAGIVRPAGTSISRACKDRRLCTSVTIDGKTYAALSEITTMNAAGETETRSERVPTPVGDLIVQILGRAVLFSDDLVDATNPEYAETEEQFLERVVYPSIPQGATNIRIADDTEVPADRTFRNAWTPDLTVDMAKARELHKDTLRGLRSPPTGRARCRIPTCRRSGRHNRETRYCRAQAGSSRCYQTPRDFGGDDSR